MDVPFSPVTKTQSAPAIPYWFIMIIGIAAFLAGLLLLISPGMTLLVIMQFLGAYWLVTGIVSLVSLCVDRTNWVWKLISGVLGVLAGLVVLRDPLWSTIFVPTVLVIFLGIQAFVVGITQIMHALLSRGGLGLALLGILNIIFGMILLFNPLLGAFALSIVLGVLAVIGGSLVSIIAFVSRPRTAPVQPPRASQTA